MKQIIAFVAAVAITAVFSGCHHHHHHHDDHMRPVYVTPGHPHPQHGKVVPLPPPPPTAPRHHRR